MKKSIKMLAYLLAATMLLGTAAGCAQQGAATSSGQASSAAQSGVVSESGSGSAQPGQLPLVSSPVTLNLGVFESPVVSDFEDNELTKWMEAQTGVDLEFTMYPSGMDGQQKIELQIASNQKLPDIIMENFLTNKSMIEYGNDGLILNLDSYYEDYAYYFDKVFESRPEKAQKEYKARMTSTDGHIYQVPFINEELTNDYSRCWFINKAWLDKLGKSVPQTTDEFYNVLTAFKSDDPNGNGKQDEIPMIGSTGWMEQPELVLLNAFLYCGEIPLTANNGKVGVCYNQDAYREALRYAHKLCAEGLLSPLSFTQDNAQLRAVANIPDGQPNLVGVFCGYPSLVIPNDTKNTMEYVAMPCLTGPGGVCYTAYNNSAFANGPYITKYCENPDVAFRFLDFMFEEEASIRARFGVKDTDWKYADANSSEGRYAKVGFKPVIEIMESGDSVWGEANNKVWHLNKSGLLSMEVTMGAVSASNNNEIQTHKNAESAAGFMNRYGKTPDELVPNLTYTAEEQEILDKFSADLGSYWAESRTRFIVGDLDIDKDWDSYLQQLEKIGLSKYLEVSQAAYDRVK